MTACGVLSVLCLCVAVVCVWRVRDLSMVYVRDCVMCAVSVWYVSLW